MDEKVKTAPAKAGPLMLSVASSPHATSPVGTAKLMRDVLIALLPALLVAAYFFGPRAVALTALSVAGCMCFEWGYRKLMKQSNTLGDLSAVVTGVLIAFVCPVTLPYWILLIGDFFAIVVVKQLFGGLGKNFLNPALAGRAFMMLCYPVPMTTWAVPGPASWAGVLSAVDASTGATPLSADFMHNGSLPAASLRDMFVGNIGGCIGEISALALIAGGIYLIWRGVIRARVPAAYLATVAALAFLFPLGGNDRLTWMLYELLGGGLMLGAFFMATDYVTSPCTRNGELLYGIGCGLLTVFIRYFGGYPEGVSYAILLMNLCAWLFDKVGMPARFGVTKEMKQAERAKAREAAVGKGGK